MEKRDYYIGLDMGTSSVGWAVTDTEYRLMRAKGKDMWGVRLFAEADTSAERRSHRTTRRNLNRKKVREGLLRELFEKEINKTDPYFYNRLAQSKYYLEDRDFDCPYTLFFDDNYTDQNYFRDYPTIYHLIMELINNKNYHDIRLVFLACLNIFKHRGHFLNDNLDGKGISDIQGLSYDFIDSLRTYYDNYFENNMTDIPFNSEDFSDVLNEVLPNRKISKTAKQKQLLDKCGINKKNNKAVAEILGSICGLKVCISSIFPSEGYDEEQSGLKIAFTDGNFEESILKVEEMLSKEDYEFYILLKRIHDWGVVSSIMQGYSYISEARIALYEKHANDLKLLKKIYKENRDYLNKDAYDKMFRLMEDNNYCAYVGKTSYEKKGKKSQNGIRNTRKERRGAKCKTEDFYKRIKNDLKNVPADITESIYMEMENGTFLPKQLTNANGVIPYQLHKAELEAILNNAGAYYPFLNEMDETGLTVKEKVIRLFDFRIPYYVGPLYNNKKGENSWAVRKEKGIVYPWNFEEKIDVKASAEKFISRMVRHCTYLCDEVCLPKESLLYEKFRVLNELNNLRINGERVSGEIKQKIYKDLFAKKGRKITGNQLKQFLINNGYVSKDVQLSGFDGNFANALLSYGKFCEIFGTEILTDSQERAAEDIIFWSTIYGDSKKFLKEIIQENYGPKSANVLLDDAQIKRIAGLKFKDWGNFSKELLLLEGADKETGEVKTIIRRMWEDNYNFMELLSKEFTYQDEIEKKTRKLEKSLSEIEFDDLEGLYLSAPVKRMTWQTILLLKEIYEVMGYAPSKIFVEMARDSEEKINGKGARKDSRKKRLLELYKNCKNDSKELFENLSHEDEPKLRSKKLYLYYMQKGRCMYSGDIIDIDRLFTKDYDIDHIYPQSVVKDDSLDNNMVLVRTDFNNKKSNSFPIFSEWQKNMGEYWKIMNEQGFINNEKYKRLTRKDGFEEGELADFVNRQLVETRQGTKVIAELLKRTAGGDCRIVYAKAGNVSDFRHKFSTKYDKENDKSVVVAPELMKCRLVNDFHHAYDAYLNIVVGNVYDVKFTQNPYNYIKEYLKANEQGGDAKERYHMNRIFDFQVERGKVIAWNKNGNIKSLDIVKKTLKKNSPLVTRMNYEEKGQLADQTIYSAKEAASKKGVGYIQVKATDSKLKVERYGGYKKYTGAYFFLVEHTEKGKRVRTLETMPLYLKDKLITKEKIEAWCSDKENGLGLVDPDVRLNKIKMYSLLRIDGFDLYLTGRSNEKILISNAMQLKIDKEYVEYIRRIEKNPKASDVENNLKLYEFLTDAHKTGIYARRPNPVGNKLLSAKPVYEGLEEELQVKVLLNILQLSAQGNNGADLTDIKESAHTGMMAYHKRISDRKECRLLNVSVTGLYVNSIDLLTV